MFIWLHVMDCIKIKNQTNFVQQWRRTTRIFLPTCKSQIQETSTVATVVLEKKDPYHLNATSVMEAITIYLALFLPQLAHALQHSARNLCQRALNHILMKQH